MSAASLTGTAVLNRLREIQRQKQVLDVEELGLIAQVEAEGLAFDLGAKSTAVLLRDALKIGARDAAGRVRLAAAVTPRRTLTGETVEPQHPQTADALAEGAISTRAAATVVAMTDKIDDLLADQSAPLYETALLGGFKILYSSGSLPTANGCATTLVLTATVGEFADGTGIVHTAHGYAIPTAVADRWIDPKAKSILVLLSKTKSILAYSPAQVVHRTTTLGHVRPRQRLLIPGL